MDIEGIIGKRFAPSAFVACGDRQKQGFKWSILDIDFSLKKSVFDLSTTERRISVFALRVQRGCVWISVRNRIDGQQTTRCDVVISKQQDSTCRRGEEISILISESISRESCKAKLIYRDEFRS